jgi:hypothetical protein
MFLTLANAAVPDIDAAVPPRTQSILRSHLCIQAYTKLETHNPEHKRHQSQARQQPHEHHPHTLPMLIGISSHARHRLKAPLRQALLHADQAPITGEGLL